MRSRGRSLLLLVPLSAVLAACGGGGSATSTKTGGGTATGGTTTTTNTGTTGTTDTTVTTVSTETGGTTGTTGMSGTTETGPTIGNLIASPDNVRCDYIPHGSLSGADQLTIFFFVLLIGASPQELPGLVAVDATSDTGLSRHLRTRVTNQGATAVQFDLRQSDFGRSHTITIVVDPSNELREDDETDNRIRVGVQLPSPRPDRPIADLRCSTRAA